MVSTCPQGTFKKSLNNLNCSNAAVKAVNILLKAVMTYQARAALQVHSGAPSFWSQITIEWGEGEEGDLDSWSRIFRERSALKPHARIQLSHLDIRGFSLKPEKFYSKTALTAP